MLKVIIGAVSVLAANTVIKDNKANPKSKEEIKEGIRKGTNIMAKYASAIYEVAVEALDKNNITEDINKEEEYFKNINKGAVDNDCKVNENVKNND